MSVERSCSAVEEQLTEALLDHRQPDADTRAHVQACGHCSAVQRELQVLAASLGDVEAPTLSPRLRAVLRERTRAELVGRTAPTVVAGPPPRAGLPQGFRREVARLLVAALAPLPLVVLWNLLVLTLGSELLGELLPRTLLQALGAFYLVAASAWLAVLYGAIPLVAHRRVSQRIREVLS